MVGNHRTIYNESLIYLSLNLNPFFAEKVNLFSIKSEPILQNAPINLKFAPTRKLHQNITHSKKADQVVCFFRRSGRGLPFWGDDEFRTNHLFVRKNIF